MLFYKIMQQAGATPLGMWTGKNLFARLDPWIFRLSGGRFNLTSLLVGLPLVMLTTTGRKSGLPRSTPLLCIRDAAQPETFALIATNWGQQHHPAWYLNLTSDPRATCAFGKQRAEYLAHGAEGAEYNRYWQRATQIYLGYAQYLKRVGERHIPIMVMVPIDLAAH